MEAANVPLTAARWTPFVHEIELQGVDLTDATFAAEVRQFADAAGTPLVSLATVATASAEGVRLIYGGTDTIANHIAAGRMNAVPDGMAETDSLSLSLVGIRINETTMEGLPYPAERGDDATFAWDMQITPSGGLKQVWFRGAFVVQAGVTQ